MKNAFIVVRDETRIDRRYWVCISKDDAFRIALDVVEYWKGKYPWWNEEFYSDTNEERLFEFLVPDAFSVTVHPITINEPGEVK